MTDKLYTQAEVDIAVLAGEHRAYAAIERHILGTERLIPEGHHTGTVIDRVLKQAIASAEEATVLACIEHFPRTGESWNAIACSCGWECKYTKRPSVAPLGIEEWKEHIRALLKTPGQLARYVEQAVADANHQHYIAAYEDHKPMACGHMTIEKVTWSASAIAPLVYPERDSCRVCEAIAAAEEAVAADIGKLLASRSWGQVHQLIHKLTTIAPGNLARREDEIRKSEREAYLKQRTSDDMAWTKRLKDAEDEIRSDMHMKCGHLKGELCVVRVGQGPNVGKEYCAGCEREDEIRKSETAAMEQLFIKCLLRQIPAMAFNDCDGIAHAMTVYEDKIRRQERERLDKLLKTLAPIVRHAKFSMEHSRNSPSSHQEFIRQDGEDLEAFEKSLAELSQTSALPDKGEHMTADEREQLAHLAEITIQLSMGPATAEGVVELLGKQRQLIAARIRTWPVSALPTDAREEK